MKKNSIHKDNIKFLCKSKSNVKESKFSKNINEDNMKLTNLNFKKPTISENANITEILDKSKLKSFESNKIYFNTYKHKNGHSDENLSEDAKNLIFPNNKSKLYEIINEDNLDAQMVNFLKGVIPIKLERRFSNLLYNNNKNYFSQKDKTNNLFEIYKMLKEIKLVKKNKLKAQKNTLNIHLKIQRSNNFKNFINKVFRKKSIDEAFESSKDKDNSQKKNNFNISNLSNNSTNKFKKLGEFFDQKEKRYYLIFFRKNFEFDKTIDFLINDITQLKEAEVVESKLKAKFFSKIAHELKTPISSILALTNQLKFNLEDDFNLRKINKLIYKIENLSNYTVYLIHDFIDYTNFTSYLTDNSHLFKSCESINNSNIEDSLKSEFKQSPNINSKYDDDVNETIKKEKSLFNKESEKSKSLTKNFKNFNVIKQLKSYQTDQKEKILKNLIINKSQINVYNILNFCKDITKTLLSSKGKDKIIMLIFDYEPSDHELMIESDEFRFKQILLNFLSNSIKFTKSGHITIKTEKINDKNVKISIEDSGIGIKNIDKNKLFKKDIILNNGKNYNKQGSGIGLSMADYIAKKLNHIVFVESEYGNGSKFGLIVELIDKSVKIEIGKDLDKTCEFVKRKQIQQGNYEKKDENFNKKSENFFNSNLTDNLKIDSHDISFKNKNIHNYKNLQRDQIANNLTENSNESSKKTILLEELKFNVNKKYLIPQLLNNDKKISRSREKKMNHIDFKLNQESIIHIKRRHRRSFNYFSKLLFHKNINKFIKNKNLNFKFNFKNSLNIQNNINLDNSNPKNINITNKENIYLSGSDNNQELQLNQNFEAKSIKIKEKILIVDDHKFIRKSLRNLIGKILKKNSFKTYEIIEGKDGIDILYNLIDDQTKNNLIKCIITDENMEYLNGSQAIKIIRKLEKLNKIKKIPIATITAYENNSIKDFIIKKGSDSILSKPCNENSIKEFFEKFSIL